MDDVLYDWNTNHGAPERFNWAGARVEIQDETLRDGAQSVSVVAPRLDDKKALLHHAAALGVHSVALGFPAMGERATAHVVALAREIADARLPLAATCAARTLPSDVQAIAEASQESGLPIEVATFIGASRIRQVVEGWALDDMCRRVEASVATAVRAGHDVMFVTEDTTRAHPDDLYALYGAALRAGARRVCIADTVGCATPDGVRRLVGRLVSWSRGVVGAGVRIDWHGHRDRGLGLANCLAAIEAGADRVHATALGLGERVGNVEMELLLVNLAMLGAHRHPIDCLSEYSRLASRAFDVPIPANHPVIGADAFATAAGTHAAAIRKAGVLRDRLYTAFPPAMIGREQEVRISPASGASNVRWWLEERGYVADAADTGLVAYLLMAAKASDRTLAADEIEVLRSEYLSSSARRDARTAPPSARA
jgi:2-isopropylmalate synthase